MPRPPLDQTQAFSSFHGVHGLKELDTENQSKIPTILLYPNTSTPTSLYAHKPSSESP